MPAPKVRSTFVATKDRKQPFKTGLNQTGAVSDEYRRGFDRVFGKRKRRTSR